MATAPATVATRVPAAKEFRPPQVPGPGEDPRPTPPGLPIRAVVRRAAPTDDATRAAGIGPAERGSQSQVATHPVPASPIDEVYLAAATIGLRHRARRVIAIGLADSASIEPFYRTDGVGVLVSSRQMPALRKPLKFAELVEWETTGVRPLPMPGGVLVDSVLVCDLGAVDSVEGTLRALAPAAAAAPATMIIGPALAYEAADPAACHLQPVDELGALLSDAGIVPTFIGMIGSGAGRRALAIVDAVVGPYLTPAPPEFRVAAIICAFNEEDVIGPAIEGLVDQGVEVFVIDNWSTDRTGEIARSYLGKGVIEVERYPETQPTTYDWGRLLTHKVEIANRLGADWVIHYDADEWRQSPWFGLSLRDALWIADQSGFNTVDHTVMTFPPIDDGYVPGRDFRTYFTAFEWGVANGDDVRLNAWKVLPRPTFLAQTGGHWVQTAGQRCFPYNFLLRHYPIRNQQHGERKVMKERVARWNQQERAAGWHTHYDEIRAGHRFLRPPIELIELDDIAAYRHDLLARLLRRGIERVNGRAIAGFRDCPSATNGRALSIVLLATGETAGTLRALEGALDAAQMPDVEVIVVENGSPESTRAAMTDLAELGIRSIRFEPPAAHAMAWDRALAAARGGFILALSDDVVLAPGAIAPLFAAVEADPRRTIAAALPPTEAAPRGSADLTVAHGVACLATPHAFRAKGGPAVVGVPGTVVAALELAS